jgi:hypothetical protein
MAPARSGGAIEGDPPSLVGQSGSYGAIELRPTASELPVNLVEHFVDAEAAL